MKIIFFLLCLAGLVFQETVAQSTTYGAGVIDFHDNDNGTPQQRFQRNTADYIQLLQSPTAITAQDIVVFPESTLNAAETHVDVPRPNERIIPCGNVTYDINLQEISCAVQRVRKYVVVNLVMRRNCSEEATENEDDRPCSGDGWNLYNTNVVFDRNGMVISLYRKFNLQSNEAFNRTLVPDVSTFLTDFNVTFGHFIGFDVLFESPAMDLVKLDVKNFVFPVRMQSEIPFLTGLQIQEGWAFAHNVNLLAASANQPSQGNSGSGIYSGSFGALQSFVTGVTASTPLNANVPTTPGQQLDDSIVNREHGSMLQNLQLVDDPVQFERFRFVNTSIAGLQEFEECVDSPVNRLCCSFQIQVVPRGLPGNMNQLSYFAVAFNGHRSFDSVDEIFVRVCAVVACTADNITTCGRARPTGTVVENNFNFTTINIRATGAAAETDLSMPNTLDTNLLPLGPTYYNYAADEREPSTLFMNLTGQHGRNDLLTFGIYVRDFTYSSAVQPALSLMALVVASILYLQ